MTLAGERTRIKVRSVADMQQMQFLCQHKIQLFDLLVFFDETNYDELFQIFQQILKLQNFKVCFIEFNKLCYSNCKVIHFKKI